METMLDEELPRSRLAVLLRHVTRNPCRRSAIQRKSFGLN
jgi:hypothetical protein